MIGRKSKGITEDPASLEGKTLGAPPPDAAFAQWDAFVEASGIDTSGITIESVGFPVREPMLAQGRVDAVFGFAFSTILNLKAQGVADEDIVPIFMTDHGLSLYGNAIMVNTEWAEQNTEAVEGFLRAFTKALQFTAENPEEAVKSVIARNEIASEAVELERLQMALSDNILTEEVMGAGFGGVDSARLATSIEELKTTYDMANPPAPEAVFDAGYLPPADARMPQ